MKLKDLIPEELYNQLKQEAKGPEGPGAQGDDIMRNLPGDVKMYDKFTDTNRQNQQYSKRIDIATEFPGAFASWFEDLGYKPGKITKAFILTKVREYLDSQGYK